MNKENIKKMSSLLKNNTIESNYLNIDIDKIILDKNQPRKSFDENKLNELADSIKIYGVLTPISVSKGENGFYILNHGERRLKASIKANMKSIPAIIDNTYNKDTLIKQLIENIQREALSIDEIAASIKYLHDEQNMKLGEIAAALGKSNAYVTNYYSYITMDKSLKDMVIKKTGDINVISEINRIAKKINDDKSSDKAYNAFHQYIDEHDSLNRNDVSILKNKIESIIKNMKELDEVTFEEENNNIDLHNNITTPKQNKIINEKESSSIELINNQIILNKNNKSVVLLTFGDINKNIINDIVEVIKNKYNEEI